MLKLRRSLWSLLTVVVFLGLAALASVNYNSSSEQKQALEENAWYQKGKKMFIALLASATFLADANLNKNIGWGQKIKDRALKLDYQKFSEKTKLFFGASSSPELLEGQKSSSDNQVLAEITETEETAEIETNSSASSTSLIAEIGQRLETELKSQSVDEVNTDLSNFLDYQRTATGADLILKFKNGQEYRLGLPFKFLGQR